MNEYEIIRDKLTLPQAYLCASQNSILHHHTSIEVIYVMSGEIEVTVSNEVHTLKSGDYCAVGCHILHSTKSNSDCSCYIIIIPISAIPRLSAKLVSCSFSPCVFSDSPEKSVYDIIKLIINATHRNSCFSENSYYSDACVTLSETLMYCILGQCKLVPKTKSHIPESTAICDYISSNYTREISLSDVAKEFGYAPAHISKIIKCQTGLSLKENLCMMRVNEAKSLLARNFTNDEISQAVGFFCTRTYLRTFEKYCGLKPSEYKKTLTKKAGT